MSLQMFDALTACKYEVIESLSCRKHPGLINQHLAYGRDLLKFLYLLNNYDGLETDVLCEVTAYGNADVWATLSAEVWPSASKLHEPTL